MLVPAEVWTVAKAEQGNAVLVRPLGLDVAVPIFIAPLEAQSILIGLGSVKMPRPLTHDLLITVLENLEATVNRVEITALREGTYYAKLILESSGSEITIDARPSDCLALAVRMKCPIYIDEAVVDEAGISVKMVEEKNREAKQEESSEQARETTDAVTEILPLAQEAEMAGLRKRLDAAIEEENYEEAARLRDRIRELEST
ncbi:MAG: bifunctional nuclease family protein [Spirochaetes bacterium]|jgi:bifunctional DNase/RNase|nr:bifunctional nuclease family protein [Spirochaetota bacterium]